MIRNLNKRNPLQIENHQHSVCNSKIDLEYTPYINISFDNSVD